ncbi:acyltransferase family protein [Cupriavidus sp. CP313]
MNQKLSSVQSLRAVAAIAVVAYHSAATIKNFGWAPGGFADASEWGWAGVDIFFFISGFMTVTGVAGLGRQGISWSPGSRESRRCIGFHEPDAGHCVGSAKSQEH